MQFRKHLINGIWYLYGQYDTGTLTIVMPKIAGGNEVQMDTLGNLLATADGASYDPDNHDPF